MADALDGVPALIGSDLSRHVSNLPLVGFTSPPAPSGRALVIDVPHPGQMPLVLPGFDLSEPK